ncbi:DUF3370 domain-containing protein [Trichothermofontia sp.]
MFDQYESRSAKAPNTPYLPSIPELARAGDCWAIAHWMNSFLIPQGMYLEIEVTPALYLEIAVYFQVSMPRERCLSLQRYLVRFICDQLVALNLDLVQGIRLVARLDGQAKILWKQAVRLRHRPPAPGFPTGYAAPVPHAPANAFRATVTPTAASPLYPPPPSPHPSHRSGVRPLHQPPKRGKPSKRPFQFLRFCLVSGLFMASFVLGYWLVYAHVIGPDAPKPSAQASTSQVCPVLPTIAPPPTPQFEADESWQALPEGVDRTVNVNLDIRPLPGKLDTVPVFNSNSPEIVQTEGIMLSTFPPDKKRDTAAHLNYAFEGRFDIFSHHIAKTTDPQETRTLFQGIMLHNPGNQPITIEIFQAATYLTGTDAGFVELPAQVNNAAGDVFSGPGSRMTTEILKGSRQDLFPATLTLAPKQSQMLMSLPLPTGHGELVPTSNARSTLVRLWSSGPVYAADLAMFARKHTDGSERSPTLEEWQSLLKGGCLAGPRDIPPTDPEHTVGKIIYGRVAGVSQGSQWQAKLTDTPDVPTLTLPKPGKPIAYGLSTLPQGTFGTGQIQSAPMLARYPDTAHLAHGNYAVQYSLTLPLHNPSRTQRSVTLTIQTPIKEDLPNAKGLKFFDPPPDRVFFRGTVRVRYDDDTGKPQTQYLHLAQRRGDPGEPLVTLAMPPDSKRFVQVDFLYPPDAVPPQVLTIAAE